MIKDECAHVEKKGMAFDESSFMLDAFYEEEVGIIIPALTARTERGKG